MERLKYEFPPMPDNMRRTVEQKVKQQIYLQEIKGMKQTPRTYRKMTVKQIVLLVVLTVLGIGMTVFAGTQLFKLRVEQEGSYRVNVGVSAESRIRIPEKIPVVEIEVDEIPEGMAAAPADSGAKKYFFEETPNQGGFTVEALPMDESYMDGEWLKTEDFILESEELIVNGREAIYMERQISGPAADGFDKRLYVAFTDVWHILRIYGGEDVTKDQMLDFAAHVDLVETGGQMSSETEAESRTFSENGLIPIQGRPAEYSTVSKEEVRIYAEGENWPLTVYAETDSNPTGRQIIQAKVTDVQIEDDLSLLEGSNREYFRDAADESGKLETNTIEYIHKGDGVDTLDEVIRTEEVGQKLVYVTVQLTNASDEELRNILYKFSFIGLTEDEETYSYYFRQKEAKDEDWRIDKMATSSMGGFGEMQYNDISCEADKNHILVMQPGETATIHVARVVNEDELDKMYLVFTPIDGDLAFTPDTLVNGYVDIRQ